MIKKKFTQHSVLGKALILGALLTVALPGIAYATGGLTVRTPGATGGPFATFSEITTHADCNNGELVVGMGINQAIGTGTSASGNHVNGISPSANGSTEYLGTAGWQADDITHSLGIGGSGADYNVDFSSTPYAVCLATDATITSTQIIMAKTSGPTTGGTIARAVATCPNGTRLLGGGARTTPASVGSLKPADSYPTYVDGTGAGTHDNGAKAAADGETNPTSWAAVGLNGGGGDSGNTTYAYAICTDDEINVSGITVTVHFAQTNGPTSSSAVQLTTIGCDDDGALISGGAGISGGNLTTADVSAPGSQGDHLNGSYPSNNSGNPVSNGTTNAAYWTAATHTGGGGSTSATRSAAFALCMTGN